LKDRGHSLETEASVNVHGWEWAKSVGVAVELHEHEIPQLENIWVIHVDEP